MVLVGQVLDLEQVKEVRKIGWTKNGELSWGTNNGDISWGIIMYL